MVETSGLLLLSLGARGRRHRYGRSRTGSRPARGSDDARGNRAGARQGLRGARVDLEVVGDARCTASACNAAIPGARSPRASSRPAAISASQRTPTHSTTRPSRWVPVRCWEAAPPINTSSRMIRAPARAMAATPVIHAASLARNASPTMTSPCAPKSIPPPEGGSASTRSSTPSRIHGCGRTTCRHRPMPVLPELEPPLRTITCVVTEVPARAGA